MMVAPIFITSPWVGIPGLPSDLDPPLEGRGDELVVEDALQHRAGHFLLSGCDLCGSVVEYAGQLLQAARE